MILKLIREGLGRVIIGIDALTASKAVTRSENEQTSVQERCKRLSLYQYYACPFCIKVRREIKRLNLPIEYRDAQPKDSAYRQELTQATGKSKVPCLRIKQADGEVRWLPESNDIIAYLRKQFEPRASSQQKNTAP